jgi:hypothetical protein
MLAEGAHNSRFAASAKQLARQIACGGGVSNYQFGFKSV